MSSKFQDSFGAGYTFQETLPCTNKIVELKRFVSCVSIRLNKPLTTYILSLTLNSNQAFHRMSTHPSNTNKHPGYEQNKYSVTRRGPAEVAAEKNAKKSAKAEQAMHMKAGLKEVAEIEQKTQQNQKNQMQNTGIITSLKTAIPRKKHKRPETIQVVDSDHGPSHSSADKSQGKKKMIEKIVVVEGKCPPAPHHGENQRLLIESSSEASEFDNGLQDEQEAVADQNFEDPHRSFSASGSDYKVGAESEDAEEIFEIENHESDMVVMVKSGGKKQKKGLIGRDQIRKICSHLSSEVSSEHVGQKRKAAQNQEYYFITFFFAPQLISN